MTSEYVCEKCSHLVSVTGEPGTWIESVCPNCLAVVKAMIEDKEES